MIKIDGDIDAGAVDEIEHTISLVRSQGSASVLFVGEGLGHVQTKELNRLTRSFRIYRQMGGRIVFAAFPDPALSAIERTTWKRFINVFQSVDDAKAFLGIQPDPELEPVISQEPDEPELDRPYQDATQDVDDQQPDREASDESQEEKRSND